ncbi:MAG: pilus assembly protein [Alphaproteobacteria bacterium]|nr:pilus assembly protein [Alphaproteobacteria bacterium]
MLEIRLRLTALVQARRTPTQKGATAVEFALIAPLLIFFSAGLLDFSLILFDFHRYSEVTRRGAREAIIQAPIASLDALPATPVICNGDLEGSVTCTGAAVVSVESFTSILSEMKKMAPEVTGDKVQVRYVDSGLSASDGIVTASVTVSLQNITTKFTTLTFIPGFPSTFIFPSFASTRVAATKTTN